MVEITNLNSGLCLTIAGGSTERNIVSVQYTCDSDPSRRWRYTVVDATTFRLAQMFTADSVLPSLGEELVETPRLSNIHVMGTLLVIGRFVLDSNNKRIADLNHAKLAVLNGLTSLNLVELATAHKSDGREFPRDRWPAEEIVESDDSVRFVLKDGTEVLPVCAERNVNI